MNETTETAITTTYEVDYTIDDPAFYEPFEVFKPASRAGVAWWNGDIGRRKVEKIIEAFKADLMVIGYIQEP